MTETQRPVRVRFAPSPTGRLHLGGARTALYDYLFARQNGGQFILRIEDTDRKRFVEGAEQELVDGLHWLGLEWDEGPDVGGQYGPYRQSERKEIYQRYARQLIDLGKAYYCFCTPEKLDISRQEQMKNKQTPHYDGACRALTLSEAESRVKAGEAHVIRFRSPKEGTVTVTDLLRGDIKVDARSLDDYIIVKSDGLALYHLAATVDDHLMKISHVIRGSEWLSTHPLHALINRAFGWEEPVWVHLSVFLKPSGKGKMSKREAGDLAKDGYSIFINDMPGFGYLPEAVNNWIALMGWSLDDHTEFFTLTDLIHQFSLNRLNPSPAAINFSKLDHFNGLHIRALATDDLAARIRPFFLAEGYQADLELLKRIAPILQEHIGALDEAPKMAGFFFRETFQPDPVELVAKKLTASESATTAQKAVEILEELPEFTHAGMELPLRTLVDELELSPGQVFGILRVAVTGQKVSPPLFESMEIIGREKCLERITNAIKILQKL